MEEEDATGVSNFHSHIRYSLYWHRPQYRGSLGRRWRYWAISVWLLLWVWGGDHPQPALCLVGSNALPQRTCIPRLPKGLYRSDR
jgi:hypothetical protein